MCSERRSLPVPSLPWRLSTWTPRSSSFARVSVLGAALGALVCADLAEHRIPNRIVVPATLVCAALLLVDGVHMELLGGLAVVTLILVLGLLWPASFGMGDVKLALLVVAGLGGVAAQALLVGLVLAAVFGALLDPSAWSLCGRLDRSRSPRSSRPARHLRWSHEDRAPHPLPARGGALAGGPRGARQAQARVAAAPRFSVIAAHHGDGPAVRAGRTLALDCAPPVPGLRPLDRRTSRPVAPTAVASAESWTEADIESPLAYARPPHSGDVRAGLSASVPVDRAGPFRGDP